MFRAYVALIGLLSGASLAPVAPPVQVPIIYGQTDVNNDGVTDAVQLSHTQGIAKLEVLLGNSNLKQTLLTLPYDRGIYKVYATDLDEDGDKDIVLAYTNVAKAVVGRNISVPGQRAPPTYATTKTPSYWIWMCDKKTFTPDTTSFYPAERIQELSLNKAI